MKGEAIKLTGPIGPLQFGYSKNVKPTYEYNPAKARELVKQAGYPNGIDVELYTPVGRYVNDKQVTESMIPMLKAIGLDARLRTPEWPTLWANVQKGKVHFSLLSAYAGSITDVRKLIKTGKIRHTIPLF